jgi:hypothetical protein
MFMTPIFQTLETQIMDNQASTASWHGEQPTIAKLMQGYFILSIKLQIGQDADGILKIHRFLISGGTHT